MSIIPEQSYPGKTNEATPEYPYGSARNITTPGDGTGTPLEQAWLNDDWGFKQALLSEAGIVPSGEPDRVGASDYLEALKGVIDGRDVLDTGITATAKFGGVERTQADINSQFVSIDTFGGDFVKAGNWVNLSVSNYCYLEAGKTYTINGTGDVYFNRMLCRDGIATVIVPANVSLRYLAKLDGTEIVHIENITYKVLGHRQSAASTEYGNNQIYPATERLTAVHSSTLKNITIYGLTDVNDIDSWVDDTGKSRVSGFIWVNVTHSSIVENIESYGVAGVLTITASGDKASHQERNVTGRNCETLINLTNNGLWVTGDTQNVKIINTKAQQLYWIRQDNGIFYNGKNCILCEAQHSVSYLVDNVEGNNALERSVYIQSVNATIRNIKDKGSRTGFGAKIGLTDYDIDAKVKISDVNVVDTSDGATVVQAYGWGEYIVDRASLIFKTKTTARVFTIGNCGVIRLSDSRVENTSVPFYISGGLSINDLIINDFTLYDCGDANQPTVITRRSGETVVVNNLEMSNIKCVNSNLISSNYSTVAYDLTSVVSAKLNNVEGVCRTNPVRKGSDTTYIEIINSRFTITSSTDYITAWGALQANMLASKFDFTIDFLSTLATETTFKARFKKQNNSGFVAVTEYWSEMDFNYAITTNPATKALINVGAYSFELLASFKSSQLRYVYDAVSKTSTVIYNVGGVLASSSTASKLAVYMFTDGRLIVDVGQGVWSGGAGTLSVSLKRF